MNAVFVKSYAAPPVNMREILRYSGCRGENAEILALAEECLKEAGGKLTYKVCYRYFAAEEMLDLFGADLKKILCGCDTAVLFAATTGLGIDRLISRYSASSPSKALMLQAIGAERIEALCDTFNAEITAEAAKKNLFTRRRFSPGYGSFPLSAQETVFSLLDCPRKIGLTLNKSLVMSPTKSVTAVIGISDSPSQSGDKCRYCAKSDCEFRQ